MATAADAAVRETSFPWWLVLLEGVFAALFGLLLLIAPGATLLFLVQVLGFYFLIGGIFRLVSIFIDASLWGWKLIAGIIGILAGIVVLQHPLWSTIAVPTYIVLIVGFLAIFQGVASLIQAVQGDGLGVGILGLLTIVFGIVLVLNPLIGVLALPFVLGGLMLVGGIASVAMAFSIRNNLPATGS